MLSYILKLHSTPILQTEMPYKAIWSKFQTSRQISTTGRDDETEVFIFCESTGNDFERANVEAFGIGKELVVSTQVATTITQPKQYKACDKDPEESL
jgi:hypothetical protein